MNKIFVLSWSSWEEYIPYIFTGPEYVDSFKFKQITDSLLEDAIKNAILKEELSDHPSWVGWKEIVDQIVPLLELNGFKHILPEKVDYCGPIIIDDEDSTQIITTLNDAERSVQNMGNIKELILLHNKKIRDGMSEKYCK